MKILILTQPLHTNYGGLLQAYALQQILKGMDMMLLQIDLELYENCLCGTGLYAFYIMLFNSVF